jgi:hypothetical protein
MVVALDKLPTTNVGRAAMRILYVYCHPLPESFHAGIRAKALTALKKAGHRVDLLDLYAEKFTPGATIMMNRATAPGWRIISLGSLLPRFLSCSFRLGVSACRPCSRASSIE